MKIHFDRPPVSPDSSGGLPTRYAPGKRPVPPWRWYVLLAIILALPAWLAYEFFVGFIFPSAPAFVLMHQVVIKAGVEGEVVSTVAAGQLVKTGEPLLRVRLLPSQGAAPTASVASGQRAALLGLWQGEVAALRHIERLAQAELALRQNHLQVMHALLQEGAATAADMATAQQQWLSARIQLERARMDITATERQQQEALAKLDAAAAPTPIAAAPAPLRGIVAQVFVRPLQQVDPQTDVAIVRDQASSWVQAYVNPQYIGRCRVGKAVTVVFGNGAHFPAHISRVLNESMKLPPGRVSPLESREQAIVVDVVTNEPLPLNYKIYYLPAKIVFVPGWLRPIASAIDE